jgi:hypothetical protein
VGGIEVIVGAAGTGVAVDEIEVREGFIHDMAKSNRVKYSC